MVSMRSRWPSMIFSNSDISFFSIAISGVSVSGVPGWFRFVLMILIVCRTFPRGLTYLQRFDEVWMICQNIGVLLLGDLNVFHERTFGAVTDDLHD